MGALTGLATVAPVALERWFAARGAPPPIDLARSGAPDLSVADVLAVAGEAALEAWLRLPLGYGDPAGDERLRRAIVAAGHARAVDEVLVTTGASEALLLALAATIAPGDVVAVGVPAYGGLVRAAEAAGGRVQAVSVWQPGGRHLELDALRREVESGVRTVVVNSPHNPTGAVAVEAELDGLAAAAARRGARLVVDEVAVATLDSAARSATGGVAFASGAIVAIGDVSKSLGLGGLRIGWLTCADPGMLRRAAALKDLTTLGPARPSQFLAALALEHGALLRRRIGSVVQDNYRRFATWLSETDRVECSLPLDGLVAFPRLSGVGDLSTFANRLYAKRGVGVMPGSLFDAPRHLRLGLGLDPRAFSCGLEILSSAIKLGDAA